MTYEQIETFLTASTLGSISAAAEELFISQSAASNRIQLLEQELGISLFIRGKGQRRLELTAYGRAFIPIASQWASLWQDTQKLKTLADTQFLNIAGVDTINNFTFVPLYHRHMAEYPGIKLSIATHHSSEIYGLVENRTADIGFVYRDIRYPSVISRPIYRELMYLICHKDSNYHNEIRPEELLPENEIFLSWFPSYQEWHDRHWRPGDHRLLTINTGAMFQHYLHGPGCWAIAPMSVIQILKADSDLTYYTLQDPPPPLICYELTNRYPKGSRSDTIKIFEEELEKYILADRDICSFEPWMLHIPSKNEN